MTASRRLQAKIDLAVPALNAAAEPVWLGSNAARLYPLYLGRLHEVATGAVPLMRRALERCLELDDAPSRVLAPFLEHHIPEELGHDDWLLEDIAALGGDSDEVRARIPSPPAASANGAQLWWIEHAHPVALLGHAEVLECSPPEIEMLDEFEARTGLPREGMMFFRRHAVIDQRHREEIHATLDALPLTAELESLIGMSALHTASALVDLYRTVRLPAYV
jgi:pyrroloquinoline quinone (PQQ) biosynthesis protein C